jgi:hypothetical protein
MKELTEMQSKVNNSLMTARRLGCGQQLNTLLKVTYGDGCTEYQKEELQKYLYSLKRSWRISYLPTTKVWYANEVLDEVEE